jgi:hypothetical protein
MGAAQALCEAAHFHALMVLELAAQFWQWLGLWGWHRTAKGSAGKSPKKGRRRTKADVEEVRLCCMVRYHAYLFVTHVDAWNQFCAKLPLNHEVLLTRLPGWDIRKRTERLARKEAYSQEDALLFLLTERGDLESDADEEAELPRIPTVEVLVEEWQTIVRWMEGLFTGKTDRER